MPPAVGAFEGKYNSTQDMANSGMRGANGHHLAVMNSNGAEECLLEKGAIKGQPSVGFQVSGTKVNARPNNKAIFVRCSRSGRSWIVDVLSFLFGFGSWIAMTGLWVELPLMVQRLPEGPRLASFLSLALQGANVGCVVYAVVYKFRPRQSTEDAAIHLQMAVGCVSCFLLIFLWDKTVSVSGQLYSIPLFALSFGMSLVDCVSSISFLPYMARFKTVYMTPYLAGEGMGGLIPSLVAMAQGIGDSSCTEVNQTINNITTIEFTTVVPEPRFSEAIFMGVLLIIFLSGWVAFVLLNWLTVAKMEKVLSKEDSKLTLTLKAPSQGSLAQMRSSNMLQYYLLFIQAWACVTTFGIFPALQPYSLIPYGYEAFHMAVTLCGLAYPLACALGMVVEVRATWALSAMTCLGTLIGMFIFVSALLSPTPPMYGTSVGSGLIVFFWVSFTLLFSYVKTMATLVLLESGGHNAMFWVGVVTQGGAVLGALLMFLLINVNQGIFKSPDECDSFS